MDQKSQTAGEAFDYAQYDGEGNCIFAVKDGVIVIDKRHERKPEKNTNWQDYKAIVHE